MKDRLFLFVLLSLAVSLAINSPLIAQSKYVPRMAFDPGFDTGSKSPYRSSDGMPGPAYWQNRADYDIDAQLDADAKMVLATVRITYTNNSPDSLSFVWLALDQNQLRADSRAARTSSSPPKFDGGFIITRVSVSMRGRISRGDYLINDTRMQVRLPETMKPGGDRLTLTIDYHFQIAPAGLGRSGMLETKNGVIYEVAQWYPHMEVYDDISGWNVLPFLGAGEFFFDYGDYDYRVTVPSDQIVVGSGALTNPDEVLTKTERDRLSRAKGSDSTVTIRSLHDVQNMRTTGGTKGTRTWHFQMKNSRDIAWASSKAYIWDAARINLPDGKKALAMSVYPEESATDTAWTRVTQHLKGSVEIFSRRWYPYPYPVALAVGGPVGGMEYPAMFFGHWKATKSVLFMVVNHEIGHVWFPMIVGSNERANAWMDEGFNTFIDIYATDDYNHGEFGPKRDHEYAPNGGNPAREIVPYLRSEDSQPILSFADALPGKDVHPLEYYKTALGLVILREYVLGKERFDYAFRNYIAHWAYKHPAPFDFFRAMNNASGENLNWFWKGWFVENWKLDQAVKGVTYVDNDTAKGAMITIANNEQLVMPATVRVREMNGHSSTLDLPVEIWERSGEFTFQYNSTSSIISVTIDPDERLPDIDPSNNRWPPRPAER